MIDRKKEDPLKKIVMKIFDPNIDSPDVFYKMEEIGDVQVLRKYDKSSGKEQYVGTYEILFKTEDLNRFCLIMTRIENEWPVPAEMQPLSEELGTRIICEYTPGTHGRIYLKGLPEEAVKRVTEKYEKRSKKPKLFGRNK